MGGCNDLASCVSTYLFVGFDLAFSIVAVASLVAALTPTPTDDTWVAKIYGLIDTLALNFGYAKDRGAAKGGRFVPH